MYYEIKSYLQDKKAWFEVTIFGKIFHNVIDNRSQFGSHEDAKLWAEDRIHQQQPPAQPCRRRD